MTELYSTNSINSVESPQESPDTNDNHNTGSPVIYARDLHLCFKKKKKKKGYDSVWEGFLNDIMLLTSKKLTEKSGR